MEDVRKQMLPSDSQDDVITIDLVEVAYTLLGNWKKILLAILLGAALLGLYQSILMKPAYQADVKMYITNTDSMISLQDLQLSSALTDDYANIITSRTLLKKVIEEMDLDLDYKGLKKMISVENPSGTHIVRIKVTCGDPELARNIANVLLNISIDQIYQIIGSGEPTVIDYAEATAVEIVSPSLKKTMAIGAFAGAAVSCMLVVVFMLLDTTIKTEEDVRKYLQLPILAAVPYYDTKKY